MNRSYLIAAIIVVAGLIGGVAVLGRNSVSYPNAEPVSTNQNPVTVTDGVQIIDLTAKGGYSPRVISAQAGIPTTLRVTTKGTFDCSVAFTVPSKNIQKMLPSNGVTEFDLGIGEAGKTIDGFCGMGMYSFKISFN